MKIKLSMKTINAIYRTASKAVREPGNVAEHLYDVNSQGWICYTGHTWAHYCSYSQSDLERNGDFGIASCPIDGNTYAYGATCEHVSQEMLDELLQLECDAAARAAGY